MTPAEAQAVQAVLASPHARDWLETTTSARALHVFDAAVYAVNQDRAILAITHESIRPGPLSLVVRGGMPSMSRLVAAGAPAEVGGGVLRLGRLLVDLSHADNWDPRPPWGRLRALARIPGLRLQDLVIRSSPAESLAAVLQDPADLDLPESVATVMRAAQAAVPSLMQGLARIDEGSDRLEEAARRLAGLGGGFTPAGDDFLMGVIYALWSRLIPEGATAAGRRIAEAAAPRTTTVSAAYLREASTGAAGAAWHDLVEALIGGDERAIETAVSRLARIGHTSGADALAGYLVGLRALTESVSGGRQSRRPEKTISAKRRRSL